MNEHPLAGRYVLNGQQICESLIVAISEYGTLIKAYRHSPVIGVVRIFWLTPDFLLKSIESASGSLVQLRVSGTYIGCATETLGREVGEFGARVRHLVTLDLHIRCLENGIQIKFWGEFGAMDPKTCVGPLPEGADRLHAIEAEVLIRDQDWPLVLPSYCESRIVDRLVQGRQMHSKRTSIIVSS